MARGVERGGTAHAGVAHVHALDGLRGVAVLLVVLFHIWPAVAPSGYIGVSVFFVLSGYLITSLLISEHARTGRISVVAFYGRRAVRLLPALLVVSAAVVALAVALPGLPGSAASLTGVLTALTYTSSIAAAHGTDLGWMTPTWSLSVEEYFYLVWPLALLLAMRSGRRWPVWVLGVTGVAIGYRQVAGLAGWSLERVYFAPDTGAESLLIGCSLAVLLALRAWRPSARVGGAAAVALGVVVLVPTTATMTAYRAGASTLVALLAAVVVAHVATSPSGLLARLLSLPRMTWVGRRSYGIYLWNLPVLAVVDALGLPGVARVPAVLVIGLVVPALSYRFVEIPMLRRKATFAPAPVVAAPVVAVPVVAAPVAPAAVVARRVVDGRGPLVPVPAVTARRLVGMPPRRPGGPVQASNGASSLRSCPANAERWVSGSSLSRDRSCSRRSSRAASTVRMPSGVSRTITPRRSLGAGCRSTNPRAASRSTRFVMVPLVTRVSATSCPGDSS